MTTFKVGDRVLRKPEHLKTNSWDSTWLEKGISPDKVFVVKEVDGCGIRFEHNPPWSWAEEYFYCAPVEDKSLDDYL